MKISLINRLEIAQDDGNRVQGSGFRGQNSGLLLYKHSGRGGRSGGYTLIEILVATAITLLLMAVVVQMFGALGKSITDSRAILESADRLRSTAARLQSDLEGATVTMLPPRNPDDGEGYFEYIEGNVVQTATGPLGIPQPVDSDKGNNDSSVGDFDDILMFTTRASGKPFVGIFNNGTFASPHITTVQSDVAEVCWFVRGRTLYRRQFLVAPVLIPSPRPIADASGFYAYNDLSVRVENNQLLANTLGDLTRRECRFAHSTRNFPFDAGVWGALGLPTLRECSNINITKSTAWIVGKIATPLPPDPTTDFWTNDPSKRYADDWLTKSPGDNIKERIADDVILTNVIGFDVKAWDPGANSGTGGYVDLGYKDALSPETFFSGYGITKSMLRGSATTARVYDTWSTHYENVGLEGYSNSTDASVRANYPPGRSTNGFDDDSDGIVDNDAEKITSPPYNAPLRGIQVKIRIFEPDSRQIREITIVQEFLQK
jgi:hypothetical protein